MDAQRFRKTEYFAPLLLVVLLALGIAWLALRLWRDASQGPPEPRPGLTDYPILRPDR